jgi:hypothetical protein
MCASCASCVVSCCVLRTRLTKIAENGVGLDVDEHAGEEEDDAHDESRVVDPVVGIDRVARVVASLHRPSRQCVSVMAEGGR